MEDEQFKLKKLKTIQECYSKVFNSLEQNYSEKEPTNIVNITINNNFTSRKKINRSNRNIKRNNTSYTIESPKRDIESFIKEISSKNLKHFNININYNQIQRKSAYSVEKKRISSLWKKTKNFQKMLNAFIHPSVDKIDDKDIFDDSFINTLLDNNTITNSNINNNTLNSLKNRDKKKDNQKKTKKKMTLAQFLRKSEVEKEFIRVNLKAKALKLITDGVSPYKTKNIIEAFEELFNSNPEKLRYSPDDKHYLFNHRLSNGKTLLYIACQEGATEIVKFFLEKRLNPNIKAIYCDMEDSCLAVAARWNYYDIVKLILDCNRVLEDDIFEVLYNEKCSEKIKELINSYIPEERKKRNKGCNCF